MQQPPFILGQVQQHLGSFSNLNWIIFKGYLIWSSNGQVDRNYHLGICSNGNSWIVENQLTILGRLLEVNFMISQRWQQTWTCHMFQKPNGTYGSYWKCVARDMLHPGYQKKVSTLTGQISEDINKYCRFFPMFFNITMWHNILPVVFAQNMKLHTLQFRLTTHQPWTTGTEFIPLAVIVFYITGCSSHYLSASARRLTVAWTLSDSAVARQLSKSSVVLSWSTKVCRLLWLWYTSMNINTCTCTPG